MPLPLHINTNTGYHHHHIQQAPPPSFPLSSSSPDQISSSGIQQSAASYPTSVPWPSRDDNLLVAARLQGHGWGQIQKEHFPSKTPNACRKRYERLIAKRRGSDWDSERFERLGTRYRELREQTWKPLADAVGEKWQDVEKVCFERGLRSLLSIGRSPRSSIRSAERRGHIHDYNDGCSSSSRHNENNNSSEGSASKSTMPGWDELLT
ncbi:hypothetical protein VTN00DRAFT_2089 [Thermoascus crustaceus]|uniref:uncharacterized protein n=1 Tax=Thermoascus crustaceus TaxID=5088 RepID=UPI003742A686